MPVPKSCNAGERCREPPCGFIRGAVTLMRIRFQTLTGPRLAKVKDLTPGELTAESYDDSYLDDEDADWTATGQGQKSAGDTSFTLAWMPGEQGQQALLAWFNEGDTRAYKIRFPNGTVDVFRGWVSSIGKAVTAKEVITRTVKVTNVGRPSMAEDRSTVTAATGMTGDAASTSVVKGRAPR